MQIYFQKRNCNWATAELRNVVRYAITAGFNYLPWSDFCQENSIDVEIGVTFVGAEEIKKINYDQRNIDKVTDVLSFPMLDFFQGELLTELSDADLNPENDSVFLGDIVICLPQAEIQAIEFGHSIAREVAFLTIHSLLHLMGYDHVDNDLDRITMENLQAEIMAYLGISREMTTAQIMKLVVGNLKRLHKIEHDYGEELLWQDTTGLAFTLTEEEKNMNLNEHADQVINTMNDGNSPAIKSGFVSIVGRPNAGKSTLLNAISGQRIAIVSRKAQTTRNNIRAIYNSPNCQIIFTDTPGMHKPDTKLGKYMQESAWKALHNSDILLLMVDATKNRPTVVEESCLKNAGDQGLPTIIAINKIDLIDKKLVLPIITNYQNLAPEAEILPISAKAGQGIDELLTALQKYLPYGPLYYPEDSFTDQSERQIAAEMIREQLLVYTHEEVPHGTAVIIDSFEEIAVEDADDEYDRSLVKIHASILCDKDSHKGIIIGKGGQSLKRIGTAARHNLEQMLDCKVYLELHVKVRPDWRNRHGILNDLGYKE